MTPEFLFRARFSVFLTNHPNRREADRENPSSVVRVGQEEEPLDLISGRNGHLTLQFRQDPYSLAVSQGARGVERSKAAFDVRLEKCKCFRVLQEIVASRYEAERDRRLFIIDRIACDQITIVCLFSLADEPRARRWIFPRQPVQARGTAHRFRVSAFLHFLTKFAPRRFANVGHLVVKKIVHHL